MVLFFCTCTYFVVYTLTFRYYWRMPKSLLSLAFLLASFSCNCQHVLRTKFNAVSASEQYSRTVGILVACPEGISGGTGVVTKPGYILTAAHVALCANDVVGVVLIEGEEVAEVVALHRDTDIAYLHLPSAGEGLLPVEFGPRPHVGDVVCHTNAIPHTNRECGEVWPDASVPPTSGDLRHGAITDHGNSGGPLWDHKGRLVGIVTHLVTCGNAQICGGRASTALSDFAN